MPLNVFKDLSKSSKLFSMGSPNQTNRKNVWCFASIIPIFIFDAKQKYQNIMQTKVLKVMKIAQLPS